MENEPIPIRIIALITEFQTDIRLSEVAAYINVYAPNGSLLFDNTMEEDPRISGLYVWESPNTVEESELPFGFYLVNVTAVNGDYPSSEAIIEFHISYIEPQSTETTTTTVTLPPISEIIRFNWIFLCVCLILKLEILQVVI